MNIKKKTEPKSLYDFDKNECKHEYYSWCHLPKYKRCKHCIRLRNGSKACKVTAY